MSSKRAIHSAQLAADFSSLLATVAADVRQAVEARLLPYLRAGESMPDIAFLLELLGRLAADEGKRLKDGDLDLAGRQDLTFHLRVKRDEQAAEVRKQLVTARFYLDQVGGRGHGAKFGLGHGLSKMAPANLERLASSIASLLPEIGRDLGPAGGLADPAQIAANVGAAAAELRRRLDALSPEAVGASIARGDRDRRLGSAENAVRRSAGLLAELCKFGGYAGLARRIRPAWKRRRRARKSEAEAAPPAPLPPALHELEPPPEEIPPEEIQPSASPPETLQPEAEIEARPLLEGLDWSQVRRVEVEDAESESSAAGRRRWRVQPPPGRS